MHLDIPDLDGALCAEIDPDLWFPEKGGPTGDAKRICRSCPAQAACLEYALEQPVIGVWGGTSYNERRELARAAGRPYTPLTSTYAGPGPIECGTEAMAQRHRRAAEACNICRVGVRRTA